jgi:hypothetical protein
MHAPFTLLFCSVKVCHTSHLLFCLYLKGIAFRTVDIARYMKVDDSLPEDLVRGMWELLEPQAHMLRKMGVFGSEVEVSKDAPLYERLIGLSGRQPK